ncbi:MAG TPA: nucleotide exchange factor GrpE [Chloroflexota bacterium]|jgi:molecular chaperone GrpE|nr:nucleotide exchange factor GrpE [Chloroflexota bacterium]
MSQKQEKHAPNEGPAATFERTQGDEAEAEATTEDVVAPADGQEPSAQSSPAAAEEGDLASQLEAEKAKSADYLEQWRRAAADFANYKRRAEQERTEMAKLFNESLMKALLPVLDNFERALGSMPEELKGNSWAEGVSLTEKALRAALEREGLCTIEALGQKFDPNLHEAVAHDVSDEHDEDSVIEEFQKGYKLGDRVIRPSMVKVSRKS